MSDTPPELQQKLEILHRSAAIPRHVAIIMDGNGRWAHKRELKLTEGHRRGGERARQIADFCSKIKGLDILTLYAFSTENWNRPDREIEALFQMLVQFLNRELENMIKNNVRFNTIGDLDPLPGFVKDEILAAKQRTADNDKFVLNLALNYGARDELVRAARKIAASVAAGQQDENEIYEETLEKFLDTAGQPDPDLLIRTSGELRISNFMLWQIAYTELVFTDILWPDFDREAFLDALLEYQARDRRFGCRKAEET